MSQKTCGASKQWIEFFSIYATLYFLSQPHFHHHHSFPNSHQNGKISSNSLSFSAFHSSLFPKPNFLYHIFRFMDSNTHHNQIPVSSLTTFSTPNKDSNGAFCFFSVSQITTLVIDITSFFCFLLILLI